MDSCSLQSTKMSITLQGCRMDQEARPIGTHRDAETITSPQECKGSNLMPGTQANSLSQKWGTY